MKTKLFFLAFTKILSEFLVIGLLLFLPAGLQGYKEYTQKVKYRIIPFVW